MDNVGAQGFNGFGKEPIRASSLIGVEGVEGSLGFCFRDVGVAMRISVRGWKVGVDPLSVR